MLHLVIRDRLQSDSTCLSPVGIFPGHTDTVLLPPLEEQLYAFTPRCLLSVPGLVSHTVPLQWQLVPSFKPRSYPNSFVKPFLFLPPISSHAHISRGPRILLVVVISSVVCPRCKYGPEKARTVLCFSSCPSGIPAFCPHSWGTETTNTLLGKN